jgi:hypothetical protein
MRISTNIPSVTIVTSDIADEERDEKEENGSGSPRTKVAYHFQGLHLDDGREGEGMGEFELDAQRYKEKQRKEKERMTPVEIEPEGMSPGDVDEEEAVRKRVKILSHSSTGRDSKREIEWEIPETPPQAEKKKKIGQERGKTFSIVIGMERVVDPAIVETAKGVVLRNEVDPVIFKGSSISRAKSSGSGLGRAYPSINRLSDSKSRSSGSKKRLASPPLFGSAEATLSTDTDRKRELVDEERAALTWHDDEITGHDPDDPDDDGEGINGIGFKPTPAEAYARAVKRRQQMLEYRNREAREARKMRSERRRGSEVRKNSVGGSSGSREEQETARRVRFLEGEGRSVISTS